MSKFIPELAAIDHLLPSPETVSGVFAGAVEGVHDVLITGADALTWYSTAFWSDDLVFVVWPSPEASIIVYAGQDHENLVERLNNGTIVLVAGGGFDFDVPYVVKKRVDLNPEVAEFFGTDQVVVSSEMPIKAALRRIGNQIDAATQLRVLGAIVTIYARAPSVIAQALSGHALSSLTLTNAEKSSPILTRVAWTRSLGSFQLRYVESLQNIEDILGGSLGPVATTVPYTGVKDRVYSILDDETADYDIVAGAEPGGKSTFITDISTGFTGKGHIVLTGQAVPPRTVIVLRGRAADIVRPLLEQSPEIIAAARNPDSLIVGPPPAENRERFMAHQWARMQRRAEEAKSDDWLIGGPSLANEAKNIGLIALDETQSTSDSMGVKRITVDSETLQAIAYAQGWHIIEKELPPVLDAILGEARRQISGDDTPITTAYLEQLKTWAGKPDFWDRLLSAALPPEETAEEVFVFPYPASTVDLLRAVVAADGDAEELRHLIGPVKVAVLKGTGPKIEVKDGGDQDE